jgi:hypothetical protein
MTDGADQPGRRQNTDARNCLQSARHRVDGGDLRQLSVDAGDPHLKRPHFFNHQRQGEAEYLGQYRRGILENRRHASEHRARTHRNRVTVLA